MSQHHSRARGDARKGPCERDSYWGDGINMVAQVCRESVQFLFRKAEWLESHHLLRLGEQEEETQFHLGFVDVKQL